MTFRWLDRRIVSASLTVFLGGTSLPASGRVQEAAPRAPAPLVDHRFTEARANTQTQSTQEDPGLAVDDRGRVLVTWSSKSAGPGTYGVFAQLFDPVGQPLGGELLVSATPWGSQQDAYVVFLRRLADREDGFGTVGRKLRLGDSDLDSYSDPAVAAARSGELLVAWARSFGSERALEVQLLSAAGEAIGKVTAIDEPVVREDGTESWGNVSVPDVVALPDGGFFVVRARADADGRPVGILGRQVAADGTLGEELAVSDRAERLHVEPSIDVDAHGDLVVAWMSSGDDGRDWGVLARRFGADGHPQGESFEVDARVTAHRSGATAIAAPDGRFAVAYNVHRGKVGRAQGKPVRQIEIHAAFYDAEGEFSASERLRTQGSGPARMQIARNGRHAAWTRRGQFGLAWTGAVVGDESGIGMSLWTPANLEARAPAADRPMSAHKVPAPAEDRKAAIPPLMPAHLRHLLRVPATYGEQAGTGFQAHDQTKYGIADATLAVGPDRLVTQANGELAIFEKGGNELLRIPSDGPGGFWEGLGGGSFIADPITTYDRHANRFFAVSTSSSPTDENDWHKYRLVTSAHCHFADFPNIGYNDTAYFVSTDCFGAFDNRVFIFDKTIVNEGGPLDTNTWPSIQMDSAIQSLGNTTKLDPGSTQFFVSAGFSGTSPNLKLQAITDPVGTPALSTYLLDSGKTWVEGPNAPQQGSSLLINTGDNRVKHGVVRGGKLYCTHSVGVDGVTRVRWYEIDLNGWASSGSTPSVADSGDIDLGPAVHTYFGDVHPDARGNLTVSYNRSAPNEFVSIEYVTRLASDPPGTTSTPTRLQTSTAPWTTVTFGDYGYVAEDPSNPSTFYGSHEYVEGPWATWVGSWSIPGGGILSYCTAKTGLLCGVPTIGFDGAPEAGATSGFELSAVPARSNRPDVVLYSCTGRAAIPFQGGLLCVDPTSLRRSPPVNSGGTSQGCDGVLRLDFNAFASASSGGNPDPCLSAVGQQVNVQWWGRDSVPTGSLLSDGLEFFVEP